MQIIISYCKKSLLSLHKFLSGYLELHFLLLKKQCKYLSENKLATNIPKFRLNIRAMSNALAVWSVTLQITYSHTNLDLKSKSLNFRTSDWLQLFIFKTNLSLWNTQEHFLLEQKHVKLIHHAKNFLNADKHIKM